MLSIWGRCLRRVCNWDSCDVVQSRYIFMMELGSLWYLFPIFNPILASWMDLRSGVQDDVIADLVGLDICRPFREVDLLINSSVCGGRSLLELI